MKKLLCIGLISISIFTFVGCGENHKESNEKALKQEIATCAKQEKEKLLDGKSSEDIDKSAEVIEGSSEKEVTPVAEEPAPVPAPSEEPESAAPAPAPAPAPEAPVSTTDTTERTFQIVTKDIDYNIINDGEFTTVGLGVADNIREILSTISTKYFQGDGLELTTIETIDNSKIAVINLCGDKQNWYSRMQGSCGGQIVDYTLVENILQRNYPGYWIDGVRFTLLGQSLINNDHTPALSRINYR